MPGPGRLRHRGHRRQDFAIVRTMVFLGSLLYIATYIADRHRLHLGRPARAAGLSDASHAQVRTAVDRCRASGCWSLALVGYVLLRAAQARTCAPTGARCCATRRRCRSSLVLLLCLARHAARQRALPAAAAAGRRQRRAAAPAYDTRTRSLLDLLLARLVESREATYSRPLAYVGFTKETVEVRRRRSSAWRRACKFGGAHLQDPAAQWPADLAWRVAAGLAARRCWRPAAVGARCWRCVAPPAGGRWRSGAGRCLAAARGRVPWRAALLTAAACSPAGRPGGDAGRATTTCSAPTAPATTCWYQALKSIRTAFVIGTLATRGHAAAGGGAGHPGRLLPGLGRRGDPVPLHRAVVGAQRAADRRLRADGAGLPGQAPRAVRDRRRARRPEALPAVRGAGPHRLGRAVPAAARRDAEAARARIRAGGHRLRRRRRAHHGAATSCPT